MDELKQKLIDVKDYKKYIHETHLHLSDISSTIV
jgi:hypothetical protein